MNLLAKTLCFGILLTAVAPTTSISNCAVESMSVDLKCSKCGVGYSPTTDALMCEVCTLPFCERCNSDQTLCESCAEGYVLSSGVCFTCPYRCLTCELVNGVAECLTCDTQHYVNVLLPSSDCLFCPDLCTTCDGIEQAGLATCTACKAGYIFTNGTCYACSSNCTTCVEAGPTASCTQCDSGFGLLDMACLECTDKFTSSCNISTNGTQTVTACLTGYEYIPYGVCNECPAKCINCTGNICYECQAGFLLESNERCTACPANCLSCDRNSTGSIYCLVCDTDYFNVSGSCATCPGNCSTCEDDTVCITCNKGYIDVSGICTSCPADCLYCSNTTYCTTCNTSMVGVNGSCIACPEGCLTCTGDTSPGGVYTTTCDFESCIKGYAYNSTSYLCISCPINCLSCVFDEEIKSVYCVLCQTYFAVDTTGLCSACPEGCGNCTYVLALDTTTCDYGECLEFYAYNTSNSMCAACSPNCIYCSHNGSSNAVNCISCENGYGIDKLGKCSVCPTHCKSCAPDLTNEMLCDGCDTSFSLYIGCTVCPSACDTCDLTTNGLSCTKCQLGYTPYTSVVTGCIPCVTVLPGCNYCSTSTAGLVYCLQCATGYSLSVGGTECHYCAATTNCLSCYIEGAICQFCDAGYLLEDGACTRGCYSCSDNSTTDGFASYNQCGRHISQTTYDLIPCANGSCWAATRVIGNETTYQRSCSPTTCTATYIYRVCLKSLTTDILECSRCCTSGGCNDFTITALTIKSSACCRFVFKYFILYIVLHVLYMHL